MFATLHANKLSLRSLRVLAMLQRGGDKSKPPEGTEGQARPPFPRLNVRGSSGWRRR